MRDSLGLTPAGGAWEQQQWFSAQPYETATSTPITWDVGQKQVRFITLSQNSSLVFPTSAKAGATYLLVIKQDATGSRTLSYTAQSVNLGSGTWKWPAGSTPTLTTTANKRDLLSFIFDGTDMIGTSTLNF